MYITKVKISPKCQRAKDQRLHRRGRSQVKYSLRKLCRLPVKRIERLRHPEILVYHSFKNFERIGV